MYTQCSQCSTIFKLSAETLRAASGQVRCGKCGEIFNALANLAEDRSAFSADESPLALERRADWILESASAPGPVPPPADSEPVNGVETALLEIQDVEIADFGSEPEVEPEQPNSAGETSLEFTLPPGELDRIFVETKHAPLPFTPPAPVPMYEDESPPVVDSLVPQRRAMPPHIWWLAAIPLALLLITQVVHQHREYLAAHGPFAALLRAVYAAAGAPISPAANLEVYELRQWGVTGDPGADGTLRVRASIMNTASQFQPYPLLRVTLANRFGTRIGTREFDATEYLGKPVANLLKPGERVDATMTIRDPGKDAEGFEIDVCLRSPDKKISCASDPGAAQTKR